MSSCKQSVPAEIDSCPLCKWSTADDEERNRRALIEHIAKEVHAFSLRSLPWNDDNGQDSEGQIHESSRKVSEWLKTDEPSIDPNREKPPFDRDTYTETYFQTNPYFADTSTSIDSSEHGSDNSREKELEELREIQGSSIFEHTSQDLTTLPSTERPETPSPQPSQSIPFGDVSNDSSEHGSDNSREKELEELREIQGSSFFESTHGEDESLHQASQNSPYLPPYSATSHSRNVGNQLFGDNNTIHQGDINHVFNYPQGTEIDAF